MNEIREESVLDPENAAESSSNEVAEESSSTQEYAATSESTDAIPEGTSAAATGSDSYADQAAAATSESTDEVPSRQRGRPQPDGAIIYVGNISWDVTADEIGREFEKFGTVVDTKLPLNELGRPRGFGFVTMSSADDAGKACQELNQQNLFGRTLLVQISQPKSTQHPRGRSERNFQAPDSPPSKTLFIGNLSYQMSDTDLNDLFKDIKNVTDVRVALDRRSGQPRGFAHADFTDVESAIKAYDILREQTLFNRRLRVNYAHGATMNRPE